MLYKIPSPQFRSETEIMSTWADLDEPLVTICCAVYNHEKYLLDALSGFLSQITKYPFRIYLRDDASQDSSADIIALFSERYPQIIQTRFELENTFQQGITPLDFWADYINTPFVAICEGDDFWTDPYKLEKQLNAMFLSPEHVVASMAGCAVIEKQENETYHQIRTHQVPSDVVLRGEAKLHYYFHTSTFLIKAEALKQSALLFKKHSLYGDSSLRALLATLGDFYIIHGLSTVYRVTKEGAWTSLNQRQRDEKAFAIYNKLFRLFTGESRSYLKLKSEMFRARLL